MSISLEQMDNTPDRITPQYQRVDLPHRLHAEPALRISVTLEVVIYVVIAVAALVLHLTQLGTAPLADDEAGQALAALRMVDNTVPGTTTDAMSPLTTALQTVSFTFGSASNTAARLPVALGAVLLVLVPALWRRFFGPLPPLIISFILLVSPVVLLAGRTGSPVIWSALGAVLLPWCVLRTIEAQQKQQRSRGWALMAIVVAASLVFLTEPTGLLMLLSLGLGALFAWVLDDDPEVDLLKAAQTYARAWPWMDGAVTAALFVVVVGTGFFFFPSGLSSLGNVLWEGMRGFTGRPVDHPLAFPLMVSLRYESGLFIFGMAAVYRAVREGGPLERVLAGWILMSLFWAVVYAGAGAAQALWLTVPLSALVGLKVTNWIVERASVYWHAPGWAVYLQAVAVGTLWLVLGMSLVVLGKRLLIELPVQATDLWELITVLGKGIYSNDVTNTQSYQLQGGYVFGYVLGAIQFRLIVNLLLFLLMAVLFFLVASLWGTRVAWRGFALGTLAVFLLFSFGLGGRAAFQLYDDPRELWYSSPVTEDVEELRSTLREYSLRATGTPHLMPVTAQVPADGALAWALRDFDNAQFVTGVGPEVISEAVITPWMDPEPVLGADYVGKDIVTRLDWLRRGPDGARLPVWRYGLMWLYRSASLDQPVAEETLVIWIRADVYGVERVE